MTHQKTYLCPRQNSSSDAPTALPKVGLLFLHPALFILHVPICYLWGLFCYCFITRPKPVAAALICVLDGGRTGRQVMPPLLPLALPTFLLHCLSPADQERQGSTSQMCLCTKSKWVPRGKHFCTPEPSNRSHRLAVSLMSEKPRTHSRSNDSKVGQVRYLVGSSPYKGNLQGDTREVTMTA